MRSFCTCEDWEEISRHHPSIFKRDDKYGWVIAWTDLSIVKGRTVKSDYGIKIKYCPLCGKELSKGVIDV